MSQRAQLQGLAPITCLCIAIDATRALNRRSWSGIDRKSTSAHVVPRPCNASKIELGV